MNIYDSLQKVLKQLAAESLRNGDWRKLGAIGAIAIALEDLKEQEEH